MTARGDESPSSFIDELCDLGQVSSSSQAPVSMSVR